MAVVDANAAAAESRAEELRSAAGNGDVFALGIDIGDPDAAKRAIEDTAKALGGLDTTVHSAATREPTATVEEMHFEHWNEALRVNLTSMFLLSNSKTIFGNCSLELSLLDHASVEQLASVVQLNGALSSDYPAMDSQVLLQ